MISYPYTSKVTYDEHGNPIYDRAATSDQLRQLDKQDYSDGVCINPSTCCQVVADTGMQVKVLAGMGRLQGVKFIEVADRVLQVQASDTLDRIDSVVTRKDDSDEKRGADYYIIRGTPSTTPLPPTLTRNASVWELGVANLFIAKNTATITQDRITDTRQDTTRCGYSLPIQTVDTSSLYNQYEAKMSEILEGYQNAIDGTMAQNLQNQINTVKSNIGADYVVSYTTPPSYSGGTVTVASGTKYVCADGRNANGETKQTISTLATAKTVSLSGTNSYVVFLDASGNLITPYATEVNYANLLSELPTTLPNTATYIYYVTNEHRYYITSGSTTASWQSRTWCKIASARTASGTINYFKPNLQLNLAQKIGKDKLLMTVADITANTDKEFVPSAVAVKELKTAIDATYGVDYPVFVGNVMQGDIKWYVKKMNSGRVELETVYAVELYAGSAYTGGFYHLGGSIVFPFIVYDYSMVATKNDTILATCAGMVVQSQTNFQPYIVNGSAAASTAAQAGYFKYAVSGRWK